MGRGTIRRSAGSPLAITMVETLRHRIFTSLAFIIRNACHQASMSGNHGVWAPGHSFACIRCTHGRYC
ncbi:unnamed protein product, partial [Mycena citricolor]